MTGCLPGASGVLLIALLALNDDAAALAALG
jgi:hypothetical protein